MPADFLSVIKRLNRYVNEVYFSRFVSSMAYCNGSAHLLLCNVLCKLNFGQKSKNQCIDRIAAG